MDNDSCHWRTCPRCISTESLTWDDQLNNGAMARGAESTRSAFALTESILTPGWTCKLRLRGSSTASLLSKCTGLNALSERGGTLAFAGQDQRRFLALYVHYLIRETITAQNAEGGKRLRICSRWIVSEISHSLELVIHPSFPLRTGVVVDTQEG